MSYLPFVEAELVYTRQGPLSLEEQELIKKWEAEGHQALGLVRKLAEHREHRLMVQRLQDRERKRLAHSAGKRASAASEPPGEREGSSENRREASVYLNKWEKDLLVKALGHLLVTGLVSSAHGRRLLDKLTSKKCDT